MASLTTGALLVFIVPALPAAALTPTGSSTQQTLINQDRAGQGLAPLAWSPCLAAIAEQNAQRMVRQGYISHTNGPELDLACGIGATRSAGENVAYLSSGIDDATANTMFMNSPGHRANIMGAYGWVGTAWAVAPNGYGYVAVEFLGASAAVLPDGFHPLTPTRILDTRTGAGGVPIAPVGGGGILNVQVAGRGGVPATGVSAVVLNVTVTNTTASSFLTVYPTEDPRPNASNLNWVGGQTVPNLIEVALADSGQLSAYNLMGTTDVIFDVAGYVATTTAVPGPAGLYTPLVPARLLDTRDGTGGRLGPLGVGTTINLQVAGRGGVPATGVSAVVLNLTATNTTASSFVTAYPAGVLRPNASNLNFVAGQTVPNRAIVKLGTGGQISLFNLTGNVDLVADVGGWFSDGSVPSVGTNVFIGVTPARVLDTRDGTGGFTTPLGQGGTISLMVAGHGGIPGMTSATPPAAVVLNVTVTNTSAPSYLRVYPSDANPTPSTSDLNWVPGNTVPNLVIVKPGADGRVTIYNFQGTTDVVVDALGWYG